MAAEDAREGLQDLLLLGPNEEGSSTPAKAAQRDTFWPCVINLAKVITGAGMMAIPRALWLIGWLPGTLMLVGVAALTCFTLAVLVEGSVSTQAATYAELVSRTCGRGLARLLQLAVLLFCFGFSVVYLVSVLGSTQDRVAVALQRQDTNAESTAAAFSADLLAVPGGHQGCSAGRAARVQRAAVRGLWAVRQH